MGTDTMTIHHMTDEQRKQAFDRLASELETGRETISNTVITLIITTDNWADMLTWEAAKIAGTVLAAIAIAIGANFAVLWFVIIMDRIGQ